jgi:uncharacterized protein involved in exopolysaccharide biosynthesis
MSRSNTGLDGVPRSGGVETWTLRDVWRDYWRVVAVGLVAMLVAFLGSFALAPTYASTSRVLLRASDTTSLNSTGADISSVSGQINSQLATALADTQAALVSNRHVAETVVDQLHLDQPKPEKHGPVTALKKVVAGTYKRVRGYLTAGFYKDPGKRENAVQSVAKGLTAKQVHDGFDLDITGSWTDAKTAADIANVAAATLVKESNERFRAESATYRDYLQKQVDQALSREQAARSALADYKTKNGIVTDPTQEVATTQASQDALRTQVSAAQAQLDADRAQLSSLESQLSATPQTVDNTQNIQTGRSRTKIDQSGSNPVYQTLLTQTAAARANVSADSAKLGAYQAALGTASGTTDTGTVSEQQAQLEKLQQDVSIASDTRSRLAQQLENASVNAQSPQVELTQIAKAAAPTYPVSPKRYLFLAVGLFLGALIGFVWSFFRVQKRAPQYTPADGNGAASHPIGELDEVDLTEPEERVGAPTAGRSEPEPH